MQDTGLIKANDAKIIFFLKIKTKSLNGLALKLAEHINQTI